MATTRINVFLNKEDRKKLDVIKGKYQLSLTTIVDILCFETYHIALQNEDKIKYLTETYIYKNEKRSKTSIKIPHCMNDKNIFKDSKYKSRFATNVLKIYINKEIKKITDDPKLITDYYNKVNTKMTKTQDAYWNYNNNLRQQRRMLKENKEYWKKALETL